MKENNDNDRTKSNENLFITQNSYADKINKIRYDNRQYGIQYNPNNLQLKNKMNILPNKSTTIKVLNSELNYLVVGIILIIITILTIISIFMILAIKQNIKKIPIIQNTITAVYEKETDIFYNQNLNINLNYSIKENNTFIIVDILINSTLKNISYLFKGCENLISIGLSNITFSYIKNMSHTFENCKKLQTINFTSFNSSNIKRMDSLFKGCTSLSNIIGLENINTYSLNNITGMFNDCQSLKFVDLSSFKLDNIKQIDNIFDNNPSLKYIILNKTKNITETIDKIFNKDFFDGSERLYLNVNNESPQNYYNFSIFKETKDMNITCDIGDGEKCKTCSNETKFDLNCKTCNNGYYLPNNIYFTKTKCMKCEDNCINCIPNDEYSSNCTQCNDNYILNNTTLKCEKK